MRVRGYLTTFAAPLTAFAAPLASCAALLASCAALLALAASPAFAAPYRRALLHFDVHVGPGRRTTCRIIGELFRPAGASPRHRVPAVLTTNGFGGSYRDQIDLAENLASAGYAVLTYSGLGFGGSSCRISMDSPEWDGQAASRLITFLGGGSAATNGTRVSYVLHDRSAHNGRQYRHDPRVGMIGGSYGGEVQFAAADQDQRLDTIVPIITWNDLSYSLAPNDAGILGPTLTVKTPGVTKLAWLDGLVFEGESGVRVPPLGGRSSCPNFAQIDCPAIAQLQRHGYPDAATSRLAVADSVSSYMRHIRIPVMLMQGEDDTLFNLNEAITTYDALSEQHTPVKMVWQSWGHSDLTPMPGEIGPGDSVANPNGTPSVEGLLIKQWFDHYLKGRGPTPALNFDFYRPWVHYRGYDAARAYASAPAYPVAKPMPFFLSAQGASGVGAALGADSLVRRFSAARGGSLSFPTPAPGAPQSTTDAVGQAQSTVALYDPPGTYAEFESAPLPEALDVVGAPTVMVSEQAAAPAIAGQPLPQDVATFVKLEDIAPDGSATLPDRLIGVARFPNNGDPGFVTLPAIVHRFPAGHRLALIVSGSDSTYFEPYPSAQITLAIGGPNAAELTLPVAGRGSYTPIVYTRRRR